MADEKETASSDDIYSKYKKYQRHIMVVVCLFSLIMVHNYLVSQARIDEGNIVCANQKLTYYQGGPLKSYCADVNLVSQTKHQLVYPSLPSFVGDHLEQKQVPTNDGINQSELPEVLRQPKDPFNISGKE
jgi:hypothetical protein